MAFIDQHRPLYRVESICAALTELGCQVAPRTYRSWKTRPPSRRTRTDALVTDALRATAGEPEGHVGRVRLRRVRHRLLLPRDRRLARRDDQDHPAGHDRTANGAVAPGPPWSSGGRRADTSKNSDAAVNIRQFISLNPLPCRGLPRPWAL